MVTRDESADAQAVLRLFNPTADVAEVRLSPDAETLWIKPGGIIERDIAGSVRAESAVVLLVTTRHTTEEPSSERDGQLLVERVRAHSIEPDAACAPIPILTAASACRFGTSGAIVEAIPGATYSWTVDGAAITSGDGTNHINLAFGAPSAVAIAVVVRTSDGCSRNGAATVALHDPFRIASLIAPLVTLGNPVTISWAIAGTDVPRSQTLTINGVAVQTAITDRGYTFTPTTVGTFSVQLDASLLGGRRRACCSSDVPNASFCIADTRTTSFTVTPSCIPATGSIAIPASVTRGQTLAGSVSASGSWTLTSALGNTITPASGAGDHSFTYTASTAGNDILTLRVHGECGDITRTTSVVIAVGPPTVSLAADATNVHFDHWTYLHCAIGNVSGANGYTYTIASARENSVDLVPTQGTDSLTFRYGRFNAGGEDTVTMIVTSPGGRSTATIAIHMDPTTCTYVPTISNVSVTPSSIPVGGTAVLRFMVQDQFFWDWHVYSFENPVSPVRGDDTGTFSVQYTASNATKGTFIVKIVATGAPCGEAEYTIPITVQ